MNVKRFIETLAKLTGKVSPEEMDEYELFFQKPKELPVKRREEIQQELTDYIMNSPELAKSVYQKFGMNLNVGLPDLEIELSGANDYFRAFKNSSNFYNKIIASAPDIYKYAKTLMYWQENAPYHAHALIKKRLNEFRQESGKDKIRDSGRLILTSTKIYYGYDVWRAKIVHYQDMPHAKQETKSAFIQDGSGSLNKFMEGTSKIATPKKALNFLRSLFLTEDSSNTIIKVMAFLFGDAPHELRIKVPIESDRDRHPKSLVGFMTYGYGYDDRDQLYKGRGLIDCCVDDANMRCNVYFLSDQEKKKRITKQIDEFFRYC